MMYQREIDLKKEFDGDFSVESALEANVLLNLPAIFGDLKFQNDYISDKSVEITANREKLEKDFGVKPVLKSFDPKKVPEKYKSNDQYVAVYYDSQKKITTVIDIRPGTYNLITAGDISAVVVGEDKETVDKFVQETFVDMDDKEFFR